MRKILTLACLLLFFSGAAKANQNIQGWCEAGAQPVVTSGLTSTTQVQQSFPQCTVTVFIHGGGTATIFADNSGTPLANPFTAQTNGRWLFYAANGRYDVQLSGAGFPSPVTYSDISIADPANQQAALPNTNLTFSSTPAFNATNNVSYTMTLTGNVTSSTITGTPANGNLLSLTLIEDATGTRTFVFPVNFNLPLGFSFNTTALATNALTFKFDGTNWNLISNSGSGSGGNPAPPANSLQKNSGSGALAAAAVIDDGTKVSVNEDLSPIGPNPYVDARAYGVRAIATNSIPAIPGITGNCSSTLATVTSVSPISNGLQRGDGVVLPGCGATQSMTTPTGITVTPSNALGPAGTGLTTAGTTGSTTYNYQVIAEDKAGGFTVASSVASTSTGLASLGAQSVTVTSCTKSGLVNTCLTSSAHGMTAGTLFKFSGTTDDKEYGGVNRVTSVPDNTHFVYSNGFDSANGAATSATGGTVSWENCNHLAWTAVTGAYRYYIYGRTGGSLTLIGVSRPQNASIGFLAIDPTWDDFGSPYMDGFIAPYWIPTTPPGSATSDNLVTTIASGAGTATLTLANTAGTSVTGATILFTNGPNAIAAATAANGAPVYYPVPASGSYVFNSYTMLPNSSPVIFAGSWFGNDTVEVPSSTKFYGDRLPQTGSIDQFGFLSQPGVTCARANPCLYYPVFNSDLLQGVNLVGSASNNNLLLFTENGFQSILDTVEFSTSQAGDYMSIGAYFRGEVAASVFFNPWRNVAFLGKQGTTSSAPLLHCNICGFTKIDTLSLSGRGTHFGDPVDLHINGGRAQNISNSVVTFGEGYGSGGTGGVVDVQNFELDTTSVPLISNLSGNASFDGSIITVKDAGTPANGVLPNVGGTPTGQVNTQGFVGNIQNSHSCLVSGGGITCHGTSTNITSTGTSTVGHGMVVPPAPTVVLGAGGSCVSNCVASGTYFYFITALDIYGNDSALSPASASVTTDGTKTITVSWTPIDGQVQTRRFRGPAANNPQGLDNPVGSGVGGTSYVDVGSNSYANPFFQPGAMSASTGSQGLAAPQVTITNGNFKDVQSEAGLTANITTTWPNGSGTVAKINLAQTWTANQSVANGTTWRFFGPNGVNWTALTGPGTNPASNVTFQLPSADSSGVQCISSNGSGVLSFSNCSAGTGTPGGSNKNLQFNNSASFGGASNLNYTSATGVLDASQLANTNETITGHRFTDSSPTGNLMHFQNAALNADLFKLDVSGNLTIPATLAANFATLTSPLTVPNGGTGSTTFTANQLIVGNGVSNLNPLVGSLTGTSPVLTLTSALAGNVPFAVNTPASPTADLFDLNINSVKTSFFDSAGVLHTPSTTYTGSGPLVLSGNGGTCPSPASNTYLICLGDSGAGTGKLSNSGVTFKTITQFTNDAPTAHGVVLATPTFPQISTTAAGGTGLPLVGQGSSADPIFTALGVAGGGSGATTLTAHGVLVGEGTSAIAATAAGASGVPLLGQGASADPAFSGTVNIANGGTGATTLAGASIATVTGVITNGHCVSFSGPTVITDSGVAGCGGAGTPALSAITAGTASNTINSTIFPQTWNWALTGSTTGFQFGENTAATGSGNIILSAHTLSASTALPFSADNNGNGWQLSSTGQLQRLGTASLAVPGTAHGVVVSEGATGAIATPATGTAGQVLISNGSSSDPSFQDPIVSFAFVNIWTAQDVTTTRTSAAVRNPIFSQSATLQMTWASITGSPATCTLQIQGVDSQGNVLSNGGTVSVSPANGTTSQTFTAAAGLQTAAQVKVIFACVTYPSTGTLTLDFTPIPNVNVTNTVANNVSQFGGTNVVTGTGASGSGIPRVTISNDSSLAANQSVNVNQIGGSAVSTAATGVQKVGMVGNAGGIIDQAPGSAVPANAVMEGLSDGTNTRFAQSDANGRQIVKQYPDTTTTSYHASASFAGSSTTDNSVFPGNATNTAILNKITVTCTQTTAGIVTITLIKRSAADTSGTSATMTKVPDDANYAAAVSAPLTYTGTGPSVGAAVGNLDVAQFGCNSSATAGPNDIYIFRPMKPIILRGTAQQVAVNMGNAAITGGTLTVTYDWEETTTP